MPKRITYSVARCPDDDWENLIDAATLEGGNRDDVWAALENLEYFSNPWVVIRIKNRKASAMIFGDEEIAQKYAKKIAAKLSANEKVFCIRVNTGVDIRM